VRGLTPQSDTTASKPRGPSPRVTSRNPAAGKTSTAIRRATAPASRSLGGCEVIWSLLDGHLEDPRRRTSLRPRVQENTSGPFRPRIPGSGPRTQILTTIVSSSPPLMVDGDAELGIFELADAGGKGSMRPQTRSSSKPLGSSCKYR